MTYENPWIYNGKIFDTKDIDDNAGFVYRITNTTVNNLKMTISNNSRMRPE